MKKLLASLTLLFTSMTANAFEDYYGGLGMNVNGTSPYGFNIPVGVAPSAYYNNSITLPTDYLDRYYLSLQTQVAGQVGEGNYTIANNYSFSNGTYSITGVYANSSSCSFYQSWFPHVMHIVAGEQGQLNVCVTASSGNGGLPGTYDNQLIRLENGKIIFLPLPWDDTATRNAQATFLVDAADGAGKECTGSASNTEAQRAALVAAIYGIRARMGLPTQASRQAFWEATHYGYDETFTHNFRVGWYWASERINSNDLPSSFEVLYDAAGDMLRSGQLLGPGLSNIGNGACQQQSGPNYQGPLTPGTDQLPSQCQNNPACVNADDPWA